MIRVFLVVLFLCCSTCSTYFANGNVFREHKEKFHHASVLNPSQKPKLNLPRTFKSYALVASANASPLKSERMFPKLNFRRLAAAGTCVAAGVGTGALAYHKNYQVSLIISKILSIINESSFLRALSLISISELGDKTFWMAAMLAAKYGKGLVFAGVMSAVSAMGCATALLGWCFRLIPELKLGKIRLEDCIAMSTFAYFGVKSILDVLSVKSEIHSSSPSELEQSEAAHDISSHFAVSAAAGLLSSSIFWKIFYLILSAELGDRSFLSTVALSTNSHPIPVLLGTICAHALVAGIAVCGGSLLSIYCSEKTIGLCSGTLFISNALIIAYGIVTSLK